MRNPYDYYITPEEYEIAEKNGVCASTLRSRIYDLCWSKERAIHTPPIKNHLWREVKDIALSNGIAKNTFEKRIKLGWDLNQAITQRPMNSKEIAKMREQKKKRVFTNEQIRRARLNGISYSRLWERVKKCKWDAERAINTPILSKAQVGIMAKEASPWSKMVIPSKTTKEAASKNRENYCFKMRSIKVSNKSLKEAQ
ncbi:MULTISPECIES: hypothetical protein [Bacillus cereus group]|uniref:hypothetical protein n=1 Tax=Bacillus cereus group TaxID=86661 RepID=UPI0011A8CB17|nr:MULTISPECIES: hypothetical protein [Bacillus cereus group]MBJ8026000.1 hypothetical protein [Bacillus cereus]MBJ8037748.1 hypothetical protein [Bacillus cereus]